MNSPIGPVQDSGMRRLKAGLIYFLLIFALGWVLGPIRELWAVPRFGRITALLCEAVIMVIAMLLTTVCNTRTLAINAGADGMTLIGNGSPCHPRRGSES